MLHVLMGDDDFSIRHSLEEIKKKVGDQAALAINTTILDGQQVTLDQLEVVCKTVPFLAEKRLVIVVGLMGRFESRNKSGKKKIGHSPGQQDECQAIVEATIQIPDSTELVLIDGRTSNNNPLFRELSKLTAIKSFPLLKEDRLRQWVEKRVTEASGSISREAVALLVRYVGSNLWIMASEVDKLSQFVRGRRIEEGDVRTVVSYTQEASVFNLVDAILESRTATAQELLHQLFRQGAAPAYILVMLARQFQFMVRAKALKNQRKSRIQIQEKLGLASDFVLGKILEQAEKYSLERLKQVYHKLLEADIAIKTGQFDGELALDILVSEMGSEVGSARQTDARR